MDGIPLNHREQSRHPELGLDPDEMLPGAGAGAGGTGTGGVTTAFRTLQAPNCTGRIKGLMSLKAKYRYGSKLNHQGTAGFGPCFHLPGFHFGYIFLTHSHMSPKILVVGEGSLG